MSPHEAIVALNMLPKIGPVRIRRLLEAFGDASTILRTPPHLLSRVKGVGPETADILGTWQDRVDPSAEIKEAGERGIRIIPWQHPDYPKPLQHSYDPPLLLYVWGELSPRDHHAISIVGSRRASHYGTQATKKFSYQLAHSGFSIVSGLARGIDTTAHEAAIAAKGRTIAVIGSGLTQLYPPENLTLAERIASGHGAVISEFPLHTRPDKQTFPMRNRIVAAWCRALLVVECPAWSGALITANLAAEYGKPVFAVPGPIDRPGSAGCNQLIRDGATLVTDGSQILDDLGELPFELKAPASSNPPAAPTPALSTDEQAVHACLAADESSIDQIIDHSGLPAATVSSLLMKLEMKGLAIALPGMRYALKGR